METKSMTPAEKMNNKLIVDNETDQPIGPITNIARRAARIFYSSTGRNQNWNHKQVTLNFEDVETNTFYRAVFHENPQSIRVEIHVSGDAL
jgi:hypothetical protein